MNRIDGFEIIVSEHLAGMKKAVKQGNRFIVSPAMWQLMQGASQEELVHLLSNLHFVEIPAMRSIFEMSQQLFTEMR